MCREFISRSSAVNLRSGARRPVRLMGAAPGVESDTFVRRSALTFGQLDGAMGLGFPRAAAGRSMTETKEWVLGAVVRPFR